MRHWSPALLLKPGLLTGLVFTITLAGSMAIVWALETQEFREAQARAADTAGDHAQAVQRTLERSLSAGYALAALVQQGQGQVPDFDAVASRLLNYHPGVSMLALGPGGVIRQVTPLAGNERALGFNPLTDPRQQAEAEQARNRGQMTVAGPLELVQGGLGVVGRLPVFLGNDANTRHFWGLVTVTIRLDELLRSAQLSRLQERGYAFELWRTPPGSPERQLIASSRDASPVQAVTRQVVLPNGNWNLSVSPMEGWGGQSRALHIAIGLAFSCLMAYLAFVLARLKAHEHGLESLVNERTAEIQSTRHHLQATLDAIPDPLFELDIEGRYFASHAPRADLLAAPPEALLGKTVKDTLRPDAAAIVMQSLQEAMERGWSGGAQFTLQQGGTTLWFELSVARMAVPPGTPPRFIVLSRDISQRKQGENMLKLTARVFEQSSEAFVVTDADQRIVMVNQAFCDLSGYTREEALGKPAKLLAAHREEDSFHAMIREAVLTRGHWQGEAWNIRKGGTRYLQWLSISRVDDLEGLGMHYVASFKDITQQKEAEERIRHLAYFDALTGLPNRTLLIERSGMAIQNAHRHAAPLAVLFVDLDHFKNINDSLGHRVGDELLIEFARRLRALVTEHDTVARLGGDEFIVVLQDADTPRAMRVAQAILDISATPCHVAHYELSVTLSIGISVFPEHGLDFETLHQRADAAMYRAKRSGRNHYRLFTDHIQAEAARMLSLENGLRKALERQQLELYYQPQVDIASGQVVGAEALIRWTHPELGKVSPAEFIPIAEDTGLILPIGEWILRTAVDQIKGWMDQGLPPITVSVNLSAVQFRQSHLPEMVAQVLNAAGLAPEWLELELTEGAAMDDPIGAVNIMDQLHAQGIRLLMDDFGTGYSSLSYLKRFQIYKLKIDQSFVRDIAQDSEDKAIVKAIISMSKALGMKTIAEGVETQGQLDFLKEQGCDEIQGYFFSKPLPAPEFEAYFRNSLGQEPDILL